VHAEAETVEHHVETLAATFVAEQVTVLEVEDAER
jgi:hypothetical protein